METVLKVAATAAGAIGMLGLFFPIPARLLPGLAALAVAVLFFGFGELLQRIGPKQ